MFINKDSISINGVNMGEYLVQVDYQHNKLWSSDSGRNLAGKQSGTLVGLFPKLVLYFRRLNKDEIQLVAPILDSASQTVSYYDVTKQAQITIETYTGDWTHVSKSIARNEPFNISFISKSRRA